MLILRAMKAKVEGGLVGHEGNIQTKLSCIYVGVLSHHFHDPNSHFSKGVTPIP